MSEPKCDAAAGGVRHVFPVRVYYEDTDAAGVVYHAGHVRFFERGRTELLRSLGVDQVRLAREGAGFLFAVRRMEVDYLKGSRLDDLLEMETVVCGLGGARLTLKQALRRGEEVIATAVVTVVGMTRQGRACRIPDHLRVLFGYPPAAPGFPVVETA